MGPGKKMGDYLDCEDVNRQGFEVITLDEAGHLLSEEPGNSLASLKGKFLVFGGVSRADRRIFGVRAPFRRRSSIIFGLL